MTRRMISICLALVAIVASTNAFASRAREMVLGTQDVYGQFGNALGGNGSMYYEDNYNMFYNPAYMNDYKNWASVEKWNGAAGGEGGFVTAFSNFSVGVFMNRVDAVTPITAGIMPASGTAAGSTYTNLNNMHPIDIMIAGDHGVKWGLGITTSSAHGAASNVQSESTETDLHAGISYMEFEPFFGMIINGQDIDPGTPAATQSNVGAQVPNHAKNFKGMNGGIRYHWGEWTPFVAIRNEKLKDSAPVPAGAVNTSTPYETHVTMFSAGLGRNMKLADGVMLNYAISYAKSSAFDQKSLPIDLSVEAPLASWITGRAGVSYKLMAKKNGGTAADDTAGKLGFTFNWGKASMDWAVGHSAGGEDVGGSSTKGTADAAHGLFTAASLNYHW